MYDWTISNLQVHFCYNTYANLLYKNQQCYRDTGMLRMLEFAALVSFLFDFASLYNYSLTNKRMAIKQYLLYSYHTDGLF